MPQQQIRIHEQIRAPVEKVFALFADHRRFVSLFGAQCSVVKEGDDANQPHGVGSVRRIGPGPLSFDERIMVFEPVSRIDYAIVRGSPLKNHLGTIRFKASDQGTEIDYTIVFEGRLPGIGSILKRGLEGVWARNARKVLATLET